ncbi:dihydrofolate reductase [Rhodobacterales bacterium HKCCE4037]|nr:dihydrofolate reductase [Rhodobacterales bacterium HKCCE4037]
MARLVFGMNVSLDGYVDHDRFAPAPGLFQHWIDATASLAGSLYGRTLYELMRYWDDDKPEWSEAEHVFAKVWRAQPKWVVSRTLQSVGPNATLIGSDVEEAVRKLKDEVEGEIDVGGTQLAHHLSVLGLIDEYRLYYHPVVLGHGVPFFAGALPALQLKSNEVIDGDVVRLTYVPA